MAEREGIARQYRDWLIPASLFVGINASVFLFVISQEICTTLLYWAAGLSILALLLFILSLFWAVTRLESLEILEKQPVVEPGVMFLLSCGGITLMCVSLTLLGWWKNSLFGLICAAVLVCALIIFIALIKYEQGIK